MTYGLTFIYTVESTNKGFKVMSLSILNEYLWNKHVKEKKTKKKPKKVQFKETLDAFC